MSLRGRIGQFLFFIGVMLLIIFFVTDQMKTPNYWYLFLSLGLLLLGVKSMRKGRIPKPPSGRFRMFRRSDHDQEKEEQ